MGTSNVLRAFATVVVSLILPAFLGVQAVQAQPDRSQPDRSPAAGSIAVLAIPPPQCAQEVNFHGYIGHKICGTTDARVSFSSGHERMFVIGLDHAVWNILRSPDGTITGWRSLGGWLRTQIDFYHLLRWNDLGIRSIGADNNFWCNRLIDHWYGWSRCAAP